MLCLAISSHTSHSLLSLSLYISFCFQPVYHSPYSTHTPFCTSLNCFPMSRKRATTSFLSKTKNQIENDRTLSFSISRSFQWKLLGELSRRRGWGRASPCGVHSPQSPEQTSADSERDGGREREREMGLPLCCYCARGQSSLNKLATHRQIQAVGNCEGGGEEWRHSTMSRCRRGMEMRFRTSSWAPSAHFQR